MNQDFREFLHVVFKRKRFVVLTFLLIAGPIIAVALLKPSNYRAQAKLLLTNNRNYLQLAPQDIKFKSALPDVEVMNAEAENLKNWSFLLAVANNLDIDIVSPVPTDREERNRATARTISAGLEITPFPTSPMIEVAYTDHDRNVAAAVANTIVDTYIQYRPNLFESPEIGRFYSRRSQRLGRELRIAQRRLDRYQRRTGIVSLQQQREESVRQMMAADVTLEETTAQIKQTEELISSLDQAEQTQPEKIAGDVEMIDNPVVRALEERIGILTVELSDLRQKYTDNDRRVTDKIAQIGELQRQVGSEPRRIIGTERFELNQVRQNLSEELYRARANLEALAGKRDALLKTVGTLKTDIDDLNQRGIRFQELDDAVENKRAELEGNQKHLQEAQLSLEMTDSKLGAISIADRANPPNRPYNQNLALVIAVALIAGAGLGVAGAFGLEFLYRTYHFSTDIERELELPVLGLISDFSHVGSQLAH